MNELETRHAPETALRQLLDDPHGAYQRWRRHEAPYHEMCRAVVLAYCGRDANPVGFAGNWREGRAV